MEHHERIGRGLPRARGGVRVDTRAAMRWALRGLALFSILLVITGARWFERKFGRVDFDQVLYHLQESPEALVLADTSLVRSALRDVLGAAALGTVVVLALWRAAARGRTPRRATEAALLACALVASMAWAAQKSFAMPRNAAPGPDWIQTLYSPPTRVLPPAARRNLLLVYVESMEWGYGELGDRAHLLGPLDFEGTSSVSFANFHQEPGTGWTVAGMVASQCGLPLKPVGILRGNDIGEASREFLPRATCLGDVLKAQGWHNVFLGGATPAFAGKGRFLRSHGYDEVYGREDWLARDPGVAASDWGVYDDYLFARALDKLATLHAAGRPFNLTLLTHGTHPPHGYVAPSCVREFGDMRDAVLCTATLLRRFIDEAQARGLLADTQVVIMGDHLLQQSELSPRLEQSTSRSIYNRFLPAPALAPNRADIDHFDLFPTILAALGFGFEGGRLGLGCSALGPVACRSLAQDPQGADKVGARSRFYDSLWRATLDGSGAALTRGGSPPSSAW